ncbi:MULTISPECIES: YceI family protein [unclassified Pseudoalteromonas]|uniref:YceI family protein n=1 Tax=unclassified Pseudoalteromonas TaxID=194690 RepID=UPI000CF681F6|nr:MULTISPECIES: YceI family protein [unclassified Pseudoalteromonas]
MFNSITRTLLVTTALFAGAQAHADWQVANDQSRVNFVSVKNNQIAENHYFKQISGVLSDAGQFNLTIDLASVETQIPIRNERMQKMLFNTVEFPALTLQADVKALLAELKQQGSAQANLDATVSLHGKTQTVNIDLLASLDKNNNIQVSSMAPVLVKPADFALTSGIDELQKVAGLKSITRAVPVSFVLTLNESK